MIGSVKVEGYDKYITVYSNEYFGEFSTSTGIVEKDAVSWSGSFSNVYFPDSSKDNIWSYVAFVALHLGTQYGAPLIDGVEWSAKMVTTSLYRDIERILRTPEAEVEEKDARD